MANEHFGRKLKMVYGWKINKRALFIEQSQRCQVFFKPYSWSVPHPNSAVPEDTRGPKKNGDADSELKDLDNCLTNNSTTICKLPPFWKNSVHVKCLIEGKSSEFYRTKEWSHTIFKNKQERGNIHHILALSVFQEVTILGPGRGTIIFIWKPLRVVLLYFPFFLHRSPAISFYRQLFIVSFLQNLARKKQGKKHFFQQPCYSVALFKTIKYNQKRQKKNLPNFFNSFFYAISSVLP